MKLNEKEKSVVELLKAGKSYTHIQAILHVSPTKIKMIKEAHLPSSSGGSSNDSSAGSSANSSTFSENNLEISPEINKNNNNVPFKNRNSYPNNSNQTIMENQNKTISNNQFELEKIRLKRQHNIELEKIKLQKAEFEIQRRALDLKKSALDLDKRKVEKEGKVLIFRFRKLISKIRPGKWAYEECLNYCNNATTLKEEIEAYCFKEDIETDGLKILTLMDAIISMFENHIEFAQAESAKEDEDEVNEDEEYDEDEDDNDEDEEDDEEDDEDDDDSVIGPYSLDIMISEARQIEINEAQSIDFDDYE